MHSLQCLSHFSLKSLMSFFWSDIFPGLFRNLQFFLVVQQKLSERSKFSRGISLPKKLLDFSTWRESSQFGKWLIAMFNTSPKDRVLPLPNGLFMACQWGHPNHFLTGMILKVGGGLNHFLTLIPPSLWR